MAFELSSIEQVNESNMSSELSESNNGSDIDIDFKPSYTFCSCIRPQTMAILSFSTFTSLIMVAGILIVCFSIPKPNTSCRLIFERMNKSEISFSSQPRAVAVGDLNNDSYMDIVVAHAGRDTIGIFLLNMDGTFINQKIYSTGSQSYPRSIIINDFNNDNILDIVVANYGINSIGIFLGNGNGSFDNQKFYSLASSRPLFITSGDFNNDDQLDIVIANYGKDYVSVLLGNGNGSFENQINLFTGYDSIPYSIVTGDFNNDYYLDIAIANYGTNNIVIFLGYGNGTFSSQQIYSTLINSKPTSIAIGDFNDDNQLDIVVANSGVGNIGIFYGYGNGTFLKETIYNIGSKSYPRYISVGDFNKDNKSDIVIVDSKNDQIHILRGYGNKTFATITTYDMISQSNPSGIVVTDFNNNNQSDIVVANEGANNVLVLIDYSVKASARQQNYNIAEPGGTNTVAVSDFNNDHIPDIIISGKFAKSILVNLGNGTFKKQPIYLTNYTSGLLFISIKDLNNDNYIDLISPNYVSGSVDIYFGHSDMTFDDTISYSTGYGSAPRTVTFSDINNDNYLDILFADQNTDSIGILFGNGDGSFGRMVHYSVNASQPQHIAVGDIDNDGYLDLAVANWGGGVSILLGYNNGTFNLMKTLPTGKGSTPFRIILVDFNNDHYLDIAFIDPPKDSFSVFLGNENKTFSVQTSYSTGYNSDPYGIIAVDFNNDNMLDIVVSNSDRGEVVIFYGDGKGNFELTRTYPTGYGSGPFGITVADLDNDKQLEIIVALWGEGDIAILTEYYAAQFNNQIEYSTGSASQPFSVAAGDFNNDNRSDIVIVNSGTDSLSILFGSNNGTFDLEMTYSMGTSFHPQYVITCDINYDNNIDLITVNSKHNSISVIMGYGNGSFAEQIMYSTQSGSYPYAAASADLNNDNYLDIVVVNEGTNNIGVFYGFDYTSFQIHEDYSSDDELNPIKIIVSDFNNDFYPDIAAIFHFSNSLAILIGYGDGSFSNITIYSTGIDSNPTDLAVGDFNNDSRLDIVVASNHSIDIFIGYGNGSFATMIKSSTRDDLDPSSMVATDFNNDGHLDIAVVSYDDKKLGILLGFSNGTFSVTNIYSTGKNSNPSEVITGDFNNDSQLDITVVNFATDNVGVFLGYGNGSFGGMMTFSASFLSAPKSITVGDFNGDGWLDIATANWNLHNVGILLGYGNGTFAVVKTYSTGPNSSPLCVRTGDFNSDNKLDIAVVNSGTSEVVVLFGFGDGSFLLGTAYSTGIESSPLALAIGDFNNDTRLDVAVTNNNFNNIGILLGSDNQLLAGMLTHTTGDESKPRSLAIGDVNNDNRLDIIVANYGNDNVGVFLGHIDNSFDTIKTYSTGYGSAPYSVAIADINNDHYLDIVVTNSGTDTIAILLGFGNGTFIITAMYPTGTRSAPYVVALGDLDNDKILDIAVTNSGTSQLFLLYGYGNGTFGNKNTYSLGYRYQPYSVILKDLNQDNWIDIIIACYGTENVEIFIKTC